MKSNRGVLACAAAVFALGAMGVLFADSVLSSRHNLSVTSPGTIKAATENQVCLFCHTPHVASPDAPLWNRFASGATYTPYSSTTALSTPGQPTGASKLCLSCHDGTVALGMVRNPTAEILFAGGTRFLPAGASNLGTDLSDDHPVSFLYDQALATAHGQLVSPALLTGPVRLDQDGWLQCTSCHDPHDNRYGKFLVRSNLAAALCTTCHAPTDWSGSATHRLSLATWNGLAPDPWPHSSFARVDQNGCENCHRPHSAASPQRLPVFPLSEGGCLPCHNGNVAGKNISAELGKLSAHPVTATDAHDPLESLLSPPTRHSECVDCHNPHAAGGYSPTVVGALFGVRGKSALDATSEQTPLNYEYELCFRCHSDSPSRGGALVTRQFVQTNTRLEFATGPNPSYHPVVSAGKSLDVPSLIPPLTTASIINCTDCHSNDSGPNAGGTGPYGPHGSLYPPILERQQVLTSGSLDDATANALCYKCHDRTSIIAGTSFSEHEKHVSGAGIVRASCLACHDPHGVETQAASDTSHLINLDRAYADPSPTNGLLRFVDSGSRTGNCSLLCHYTPTLTKDHAATVYPP